MNLQLERIELREIELPLKSPFETSFGRTTRRRILIVRVFDKTGASGYGECVAAEGPFLQSRNRRHGMADHVRSTSRPLLTRAARRNCRGSQRRARTNSRQPDGQGRRRGGDLGS